MTASLLTLTIFGAFVRIWGSWRWWLRCRPVHEIAPAPLETAGGTTQEVAPS